MQFVKATRGEAVKALLDRLSKELSAGQKVLWLVSGGSNIGVAVEIMAGLTEAQSTNLTVMLVDERYGPPGHNDSNWNQLIQAGFEAKQAKLLPALKEGLNFAENTAYYNALANQAFGENQIVIGQLGIGPDGHVAGILPHSAACAATDVMVTAYAAPPLRRMTLTFAALKRINAVYALAFGENKRPALTQLKNENLDLADQPAQIFKDFAEAYVYNDQLGNE